MIWPFKRKAPDIRFSAIRCRPDISAPVVSAKSAPRPAWLTKQASNPPLKFARCPGMWDYYQMGYIIPAWCDIHIKATKHGVSVRMEGPNHDDRSKAVPMDFSLIEGMAPIGEDVAKVVLKIPAPWAITTAEGISALLMPPTMHSDHMDKLAFYPGRVDYSKKFHTLNVVISVLKECEFTIWAGEPLLQVIPIPHRDYTAECGLATEREFAESRFSFMSKRIGFYRKLFHTKQKYEMTLKEDV